MKWPNQRKVILLHLMNEKAIDSRGGTVLESSTRPCLQGSITSPKSTALPKTVKPCHPFRGFLFQTLFLINNANIPSSNQFIGLASPSHWVAGNARAVLIGVIRGEILSGLNSYSKIWATRAKGNHPKLRLARQINCLSTFVVLEHLRRFTGVFRLVSGVRVEHLRVHLRKHLRDR